MVIVFASDRAIKVKNIDVFEKEFSQMNSTISSLRQDFIEINPEIQHLKKYGRFYFRNGIVLDSL